MSLRTIAQKVASNLPQEQYRFDPTIIILIMEAIMTMIQTLMENCNPTPEEAVAMAQDPGPLQKVVLRLRVRRILGMRAYRNFGNEIVESMIKVTAESTSAEIQEIYDEVDGF